MMDIKQYLENKKLRGSYIYQQMISIWKSTMLNAYTTRIVLIEERRIRFEMSMIFFKKIFSFKRKD